MKVTARYAKNGEKIRNPVGYVPQNPEPLARFLRELDKRQEQIIQETA